MHPLTEYPRPAMRRDSYENLDRYLDNGVLFTPEELEDVYWRNALEAFPFPQA